MKRWLLGYVVAICAIGGIVVVQNLIHMSVSDWASWAQAIGATVGLGIAIWVPLNQRRYESDKVQEAALLEKARIVTNAHEVAKDALLALEGAKTYIEGHDAGQEFSHTTERLEMVQLMLKDVMNTALMPAIFRRVIRINRQVTLTIRDVKARHNDETPTVSGTLKRNMEVRMGRATESLENIGKKALEAQNTWKAFHKINETKWR